MDKDRIFGLFDFGGDEEGIDEEYEMPIKLEDYKNTATFKIGMFIKIIKNHEVFHRKLEKFFEDEISDEYEVNNESKEFSKLAIYNRAWSYIKDVSVDDKDDIFEILGYEYKFPGVFMGYLEMLIQFYEEREEYMRCAHLFKIYTVLKESK